MISTPVRLTESAALKLPRLGLFALLFAYALPGLFGRDPWRSDDAAGFGVMWSMAQGGWSDWLMPHVVGIPFFEDGPLYFWFGALCIKLFGGFLPAHEVARLGTLVALLVATASIWYAVYLLGRRAEAQPQQFAFGGQPNARDYGRALADGALMVCLAMLGLLVRAHETSAELPQFAFGCFALYALARSLDRPIHGAIALGLSVAGLTLGHTVGAALVPLVTAAALTLRGREWRVLGWRWWAVALVVAALPVAAWLWAVQAEQGGAAYLTTWWAAQGFGWWFLSWSNWAYYLRNLPWYTWPAWPLAAWAVWAWRAQWRTPHMTLGLVALGVGVVAMLVAHEIGQAAMMIISAPLILLAAFALPTLRRGTANLIDWFALMMFSVFAVLIWLGWIAMMTGTPAQIAHNFAKLAPGFVPEFSFVECAIALIATFAWGWLVWWRVRARPEVLWRTVVLSAAGVTIVWTLFMTLLLPYVDYLKTYRHVAEQITEVMPRGQCVRPEYLGPAQRASLAYFNDLHFGSRCGWLLRYQNVNQTLPAPDAARWRKVWEGRRATDRSERFTLYRRVEAPDTGTAAP